VIEAAQRGADVVELGVPFSDPLADGPVIQRASQRALQAGVTRAGCSSSRASRGETSVPLVFMTYYNPILAFGAQGLCGTAVESGVDGVIVADLPPEESGPLRARRTPPGSTIHLVAPTSTPDRMRKIALASSGFLYMVSLTGVTGVRAQLPAELQQHLRTLRGITTKPICVGFGIGTPEQAAAVGQAADGVIVASAIVQIVEKHAGSADLVTKIGDFIASLKEPLRPVGETSRA
jgi:tryptophan synthase alpha chain